MVKTCCVYKCRNRANSVAKVNNISFFRFPANKKKLQAWIKAVNREDWEPNGHTNICSDHFVFGWHSDDPNDDNYAPTLFIQKENKKLKKLGKKNDKIASYKSPEKVLIFKNTKRGRGTFQHIPEVKFNPMKCPGLSRD